MLNRKPRIIVYGQAQNGKDTTADYLQLRILQLTKDKQEWIRRDFASYLKEEFCRIFDISMATVQKLRVSGDIHPKFGMPIRKALQQFGGVCRAVRPSIFIEKLLEWPAIPGLIASDGRHLDELVAMREVGAYQVLVIRRDHVNNDPHESEAEMRAAVKWLDQAGQSSYIGPADRIPGYPYQHDFILRNDWSKLRLYEHINRLLLPTVASFYGLDISRQDR